MNKRAIIFCLLMFGIGVNAIAAAVKVNVHSAIGWSVAMFLCSTLYDSRSQND